MKQTNFKNKGNSHWYRMIPDYSKLKEGDVINSNFSPLGKAFGEVQVIKFSIPRNEEI